MTAWARLTWQAADPSALAAELVSRLGPGATARTGPGGAHVVRLGAGDLELVPWRREAADDEPHPAGRLVFEPVDPEAGDFGVTDEGEHLAAGSPLARSPSSPVAYRLAGVGWATVELDRAEAELHPWLAQAAGRDEVAGGPEATHEPHLGARTRVRRSPGLPGDTLVLAEPVTEGRLAASLARDGEGPCVLYLEAAEGLEAWRVTAASRGVVTSSVRPGPLGPSVLLAGRPSGPHLVMVDRQGSSSAAPGGTIAP